jgi:multicomponent Na+:H+ antiporter subunit D
VSDLLPLLVAVPLLGALAPLVVGVRRPGAVRRVTAAVLVVHLGVATAAVWGVVADGALSYVVGGLPAAYGIGLRLDAVSSAFVLLVAVASAAAHLAVRADPTGPTDSLWLLLVAGLTGVCVTADVFNLYVFLEISGLAAYALVASRRGAAAALAALNYLLVGTVGATLYLLGVGYAYVATGTLSMAALRVELAAAGYDSPLVVAAFVLVALGLSVKVALFPVHVWKPDAYRTAPTDVSVLLAALGSTVAGYALVRVTFDVFTASFLAAAPLVGSALTAAGLVSVLAGGYLTLRQTNLQRLFAYSSVLQFGLVVVGVGLATPAAVTGALVLLLGHAVAKGSLFAAAGAFERRYGAKTLADYAGLGRESPVLATAVAVLFASLVGLPPTAGFAGKWYVALGAVASGSWVAAAVVVLSTLLSLAYAGRIVERLFLAEGDQVGAVAADGGTDDASDGPDATSVRRTVALVVVAAFVVVVAGLASTALSAWFAPVVEGWL